MASTASNSKSAENISNEELEKMCADVWKELEDDAILDFCFYVHRAAKLGSFFLGDGKYGDDKFEIAHIDRLHEIFGHSHLQEAMGCKCPKCGTYSTASRFVIHLTKCLNKRQCAMKSNERPKLDTDSEECDNESDDSKKGRKRSNRKQARKQKKGVKRRSTEKSGSSAVLSGNQTMPNFSEMPPEVLRAHLRKVCGVISEWTKKMCTKSMKCSKHTEEQRRSLRDRLVEFLKTVNIEQFPEDPLDVDSVP